MAFTAFQSNAFQSNAFQIAGVGGVRRPRRVSKERIPEFPFDTDILDDIEAEARETVRRENRITPQSRRITPNYAAITPSHATDIVLEASRLWQIDQELFRDQYEKAQAANELLAALYHERERLAVEMEAERRRIDDEETMTLLMMAG